LPVIHGSLAFRIENEAQVIGSSVKCEESVLDISQTTDLDPG
jgi:hypothetical protein